MKSGKAIGPSEVSLEMIIARGKIGVKVIDLYQHILYGRRMPDEWTTGVILPIFKKKE